MLFGCRRLILGILLFISGKCFSQMSTNSFPYNCSFSILSSIREAASRIWRKRNEKIREGTVNFQNETSCYEELFIKSFDLSLWFNCQIAAFHMREILVRLAATIFSATQRCNSVATLLRHCLEWLQHCSNTVTLCSVKNRRCESSRVTSP